MDKFWCMGDFFLFGEEIIATINRSFVGVGRYAWHPWQTFDGLAHVAIGFKGNIRTSLIFVDAGA